MNCLGGPLKTALKTLLLVFLFINAFAIAQDPGENSVAVDNVKDGEIMTMDGYVDTVPRFFNGKGGEYQSFSFNLSAEKRVPGGPQHQYVIVKFLTKKWGVSVGEWPNYNVGDKVSLKGKFVKARESFSSNLLGSFYVNDKSYQEVIPKTP